MADGDAKILTGSAMQIDPQGSGCGGMIDMVAQTMLQVVNPATAAGVGVCDKLFRKSSFAEVLERYATVFPRWVSTTPAAIGGNLRLTVGGIGSGGSPSTDGGSLEFFRNGIDQDAIASNPIPRQTQNVPDVGSIGIGEGAPRALTFNETNGLQPMVTGSGNADFVQDEGQDFVFGAMAVEVFMDVLQALNASANAGVQTDIPAWATQGSTSYSERLLKSILTGSNLRISWRDEGQDRFYRVMRPMDWPSYTGAFGSKNTLSPGQPAAFQFKELPFALQTNRRPKVDTNARVKFFLDLPESLTVTNDPVNQVPVIAGPTPTSGTSNLQGTVFTPITLKLFGAMVCVDRSTGQITESTKTIFDKMYEQSYAQLTASGIPAASAQQLATQMATNAMALAAK